MSDPVTNVEIEDVLSSIRRLISEDGRGEKKPETAEQATWKEPKPEDRLVLTPALRVADAPVKDAYVEDAGDETAEDPTAADLVAEDDSPEDDSPEDHGSDEHISEDAVFETEADDSSASGDTQIEVSGPDEDHRAEEASESDTLILESEPEPVEAEAEDTPEDLQAASDDEEAASDALTCEMPDRQGDSTDAGPEPEAQAAEPEGQSDTLENRVAELEAIIDAGSEQFEPDLGDAEPYADSSSDPMAWQDADPVSGADADHEDPVVSTFRPDIEDHIVDDAMAGLDSEDTLLFAGEDAVIDEDMLRDLVSEIVRQELQGALGERITRNVRKLVRREIQRALASQEFD